MSKTAQKNQGFTLMEVLVAMVILSIISAAALYAVTSSSGMGKRNTDMMKAFACSRQKLDSLKVITYDSLNSGSDTLGTQFVRSWHVTATRDAMGALDGRKKILLDVYWPLTGDHSLSMGTVVSDDRFKETR